VVSKNQSGGMELRVRKKTLEVKGEGGVRVVLHFSTQTRWGGNRQGGDSEL